jgi:glycosyltransferase involved in cell wall biosynthesis
MHHKRCILISPDFPPPMVGGSLVYMQTLVENSKQNFDILAGLSNSKKNEVISSDHYIHRTKLIANSNNPSSVSLAISYAYMFFWVLNRAVKGSYKAIIANPGVIGNSLLIALGIILKKKVIVIAYGEEITVPLEGGGFKNFLKRKLLKFFYKRAAGIVTVCHFCKEILVDKLDVNPEYIDVIPSCLAAGKANKTSAHIRDSYKILSVGRLIERKGFHLLIDSIKRIKENIPLVSLTIVGDGFYRDKLLNQVHTNDMASYVQIINDADDDQLQELYSSANLFVLANHKLSNGDTEGCPTVFSEAMAYGLPLIGGTGAGVDTAIIDGENGFIVNAMDDNALDQAIFTIFSNKNLAKEMSVNARAKLERDHSPSVVGAAFRESIIRFICHLPAKGFQKEFNIKCPSLNFK